jgi:hypothetical protein
MGKRLIGSVGLKPGTDTGFDLDEKGQIHGYSDTQFALPVGDDDQVLTADSGEDSGLKWATAGGGKLVLLETFTATGDVTTKTFTTDRNLKDTYQELIIFINGQVGVSAQDLTLAMNADTSGYTSNTTQSLPSGVTNANTTGASNWVIGSSTLLDIGTRMYEAEIHITWNPSATDFQVSSRLSSIGKGQSTMGGYVAGTTADGISTDLTVAVSAGDMSEGLQINIYAVER